MSTICREACINFKELCKKKHADGLWMEELAAVKAFSPSELSFVGTSGIVLTNEISAYNQSTTLDSSKDGASSCNLVANGSLDTSKSGSSTSTIHSYIAFSALLLKMFFLIQMIVPHALCFLFSVSDAIPCAIFFL
jgi:hypothetical protein